MTRLLEGNLHNGYVGAGAAGRTCHGRDSWPWQAWPRDTAARCRTKDIALVEAG